MLTRLCAVTIASFGLGLGVPVPENWFTGSTEPAPVVAAEAPTTLTMKTTIVNGDDVVVYTDATDVSQHSASTKATPAHGNRRATLADLQDSHVI